MACCNEDYVQCWHDFLDEALDLGCTQQPSFSLGALEKEEASLILDRRVETPHGILVVVDSMARDVQDLRFFPQHLVKVVLCGYHTLEFNRFARFPHRLLDGLRLFEEV